MVGGSRCTNVEGHANLVAFQRQLALEDISLTHTIVHPTIDRATDANLVDNPVPLHKTGDTEHGIVVRGARILATLAPFADEIAVYPATRWRPAPRPCALSLRSRSTRPASCSCVATRCRPPAPSTSIVRCRRASTSRTRS